MTDRADGRRRVSYLTLTQFRTVDDWCGHVRRMFDTAPILVGSSNTRPDWRDIDIRLVMADGQFDTLDGIVSVVRLNHVVSLWGTAATGLPIDFQVQRRTEADMHDGFANPMGVRSASPGSSA